MSKSRKAQCLSKWTSTLRTTMSHFHQSSLLMVRKHQKSNIKSSSFAITLKDLAINENAKTVSHALESLSTSIAEMENHRLQLLSNLQYNIVEEFGKYDSRLKVQESNIAIRNTAYLKFNKKQKDYLSTRGRAAQQKQDHAKAMLEEERKRLQAAEDVMNGSVAEFEKERITDIKTYLTHYLNSHIYFHSKCLEHYTSAYESLCHIDAETEKNIFIDELKRYEMEDQADNVPQHGVNSMTNMGGTMGYTGTGTLNSTNSMNSMNSGMMMNTNSMNGMGGGNQMNNTMSQSGMGMTGGMMNNNNNNNNTMGQPFTPMSGTSIPIGSNGMPMMSAATNMNNTSAAPTVNGNGGNGLTPLQQQQLLFHQQLQQQQQQSQGMMGGITAAGNNMVQNNNNNSNPMGAIPQPFQSQQGAASAQQLQLQQLQHQQMMQQQMQQGGGGGAGMIGNGMQNMGGVMPTSTTTVK